MSDVNRQLGKIGTPPPEMQGIGFAIFRDHRNGSLSERDYFIASAAMVADHPHYYRQQIFPVLSQQLCGYLDGRIQSQYEFDPEMSKKIGSWIMQVVRCSDENTKNLEMFVWSIEKLDSVGLNDKSQKIRSTIERFSRQQFPEEIFERALRVQKMDAEARQRAAR